MAVALTLDDVRRAWDARDPRLITLIEQLCTQPVPAPDTPIRDGALTFEFAPGLPRGLAADCNALLEAPEGTTLLLLHAPGM